ncbi:MAG: bifunctional (p)ppGpp synthetase/guanosine-3',5'-bis(diphosphate) 3'-pyrophosphohydrolase [Proteobacteria bacterium]|nr:bifunctional (p)ppGpp synthetase/guanosine-3',5'-bis(diphosphate) 3'-pyrophosphohydrolase [Pseudomonadota bacterium]
MLSAEELYNIIKVYYPLADKELLFKAYDFSLDAHKNQKRASGDSYFLHPLAVSEILATLKLDLYSVITGLLHDTLEDTPVTYNDIYQNFGPEIAQLVDGITKLSRLELQSEQTQQAENFRKLLLAMSSDIRVLLVKLADRLHNMRTLHFIESKDKRHRIARESLDIFCPLAERIGMMKIKEELEDIAFQELHPEIYESIQSRLRYLRELSGDLIEKVILQLDQKMRFHGMIANVSGREKSAYSIWRKMQLKNVSFEQISDVMAFRITVSDITECYQALGIIHQEFSVVPGRFKDYISTPKPNGYQAIHTVILGPFNTKIEIQIKTTKMQEFAEHGLAAHWRYKTTDDKENKTSSADVTGKQYAWIRSLLDILETADGMDEFLEHTKLEIYQDQVFCFTPNGKLIALPKGATSIDFAYAIHSNIGDKTIGAKVNGRPLPLRSVLHNGDQVEILTDEKHTPSPMWERFVVTGKARSAIRRYIKTIHRKEFLDLGKNLLQKAFLKDDKLFCEKALLRACKELNLHSTDDLFVVIGEGKITTREIQHLAYPVELTSHKTLEEEETLLKKNSNIIPPMAIKGMIPGMALNFAACCHPIPGDRIIGIITTGKGIAVHTRECETATYKVDLERIQDLIWEEKLSDDARFVARLKVVFLNKVGSLAQLTGILSKKNANIVNFRVINRNESFWEMLIDIDVKDRDHLSHIIAAIHTLKMITQVDRA